MKRFVSTNLEELKEINVRQVNDEYEKGNKKPSTMFMNGKFKELKGNVLTKEMKFKFIDYMCVDNMIEIFLVKVNNQKQKNISLIMWPERLILFLSWFLRI